MKRLFFLIAFVVGTSLGSGFALSKASAVEASALPAAGESVPAICFIDRPTAPVADVPAQVNSVTVRVTAIVDAGTRVHLDKHGRVVAVATNSGCAPKGSDEFSVESGNKLTPASGDVKTSALACRTSGSWEDTKLWHKCH